MNGLWCFFVFLIEIIIEIKLLINFKRDLTTQNYYKLFILAIVILVFSFLTFIININGNDLGSFIVFGFLWMFFGTISLIIFIIGHNKKRKVNFEIDSQTMGLKNKAIFKYFMVLVVCNVTTLFLIPFGVTQYNVNVSRNYIYKYLNNKYGNGNFKVKGYHKKYHQDLFTSYFDGYYFNIETDYMDKPFMVCTDGEVYSSVNEDYFLPVYYSLKYNFNYELEYDLLFRKFKNNFMDFDEYLEKQARSFFSEDVKVSLHAYELYQGYVSRRYYYNFKKMINYDLNYYIIDDHLGRIPTMDEIVDGFVAYYKS